MNDIKAIFGKVLGEIYRLQDASGSMTSGQEPGHIYGLRHGIEDTIDREIEAVGWIPNAQLEAFSDILGKAQEDPKFKGYYDIESELKEAGIERVAAIRMLRYFKASGRFADVISKMDSMYSPIECKNFDLEER